MKVIVIGLFSILWMQKASSAPKWSTPGDYSGDDNGLTTDYDFLDTDLDFYNGTTCYNYDDNGLIKENDLMDLDLDFDNGTCYSGDDNGLTKDDFIDLELNFDNGTCDDDNGQIMKNRTSIMDLDIGTGLYFNVDGHGTDFEYALMNTDNGYPSDGPTSPKNTDLFSAWFKAANRAIALAGLACLLKALHNICRRERARLMKKGRESFLKRISEGKQMEMMPQPTKTDNPMMIASVLKTDRVDTDRVLQEQPLQVKGSEDINHPPVPSLVLEKELSPSETEPSGCDGVPKEWAINTDLVASSGFESASSAHVPGIDPEFIRFIESFDWDTMMPRMQNELGDTDDAEMPTERFPSEVDVDMKESLAQPSGDTSPKDAKMVTPEMEEEMKQKQEPVTLSVNSALKSHGDIPAWKKDIRHYLANLPEGILDKRNRMEQPTKQKPPRCADHLAKKHVSFSEEVAVKKLFAGRTCPSVPKAMRKKVRIRMIVDMVPLKEERDAEPFKLLRRSKKILSLLRF